jgi:hypothetical protein
MVFMPPNYVLNGTFAIYLDFTIPLYFNVFYLAMANFIGNSANLHHQQKPHPGRTEPTLAPSNHRHGLARARPDSPALRSF